MGLKSSLFLPTPVWTSALSAPSFVKPAASYLKISYTRTFIIRKQPPRETTRHNPRNVTGRVTSR